MRTLLLWTTAGVALGAMPWALAPYPLFVLGHILVIAIACLGLNLLYGTAGSLSFGHGSFFGLAAYAGAFFYRFGFADSFEIYLMAGVLTSVAFAIVLGFVCVRASNIFFAILTLALSMLLYSLFINGTVFRLFGGVGWALYLLGGGSMYLPRLSMLGVQYPAEEFVVVLYYAIAATFLAATLVLWRIGNSPFGMALRAIRESETRAAFIGIPVWRYRWAAFVVSAGFVGLAGALYGQLARQITPDQLHWLFSAQLILAIVLGGARHFLGPVAGAFVFVMLDEVASQWSVGRYAAFGALLIVTVLAFPRGVAGGLDAIFGRRVAGSSRGRIADGS